MNSIKLIQEIMSKAIIISSNSEIDVFVQYAPHVESINVWIYDTGFSADTGRDYDSEPIYLDWEGSEEKLQVVLDKLIEIEKGLK